MAPLACCLFRAFHFGGFYATLFSACRYPRQNTYRIYSFHQISIMLIGQWCLKPIEMKKTLYLKKALARTNWFCDHTYSFKASSKKTSDEMVVWYGSGHQKANKITLLFPPEWQILHFIELIEGYTTPTRNSLVNTLLFGNFILKAKANKKSNRSNVDHWLWEQEGDNQEYLSRFTKMFLQWLPGAFALKMKNISPKDLSGVRLISR